MSSLFCIYLPVVTHFTVIINFCYYLPSPCHYLTSVNIYLPADINPFISLSLFIFPSLFIFLSVFHLPDGINLCRYAISCHCISCCHHFKKNCLRPFFCFIYPSIFYSWQAFYSLVVCSVTFVHLLPAVQLLLIFHPTVVQVIVIVI